MCVNMNDETNKPLRIYSLHQLDEEDFFKKILAIGEGKNIEFKLKLSPSYEIAKEISAFANSEGGLIIYGINDRCEVIGIKNSSSFSEIIFNALKHITPHPELISIKSVHFKGKEVGAVLINPSLKGPFVFKGEYFTRVGTVNIRANKEEYSLITEKKEISESIQLIESEINKFMLKADEDAITNNLIVPLLRDLKFESVVSKGHTDKTLEFGQDIRSFKYQIPTGHWLYFVAQIKKEDIVYSARGKNDNVANILTQLNMAFEYEVFDYQLNTKNIPDHVFLITTGNIAEGARTWLVDNLIRYKKRHILFLEKENILEIIHNNGLPQGNQTSIRKYLDEIYRLENFIEGISAHLFFPINTERENMTMEYHGTKLRFRLIINHKSEPPEAYYLTPESFGWRFIEQFPEIWVSEVVNIPMDEHFIEKWCKQNSFKLNKRVASRNDLLSKMTA